MVQIIIDELSRTDDGKVELTLRQVEPWEQPDVLPKFKDKLNGYIHLIHTQALYENYPDLKGKPLCVRIIAHYSPPDHVLKMLDLARNRMVPLGLDLKMVLIQVGNDDKESLTNAFKRFFKRTFKRK
jgi:hypothetical protein